MHVIIRCCNTRLCVKVVKECWSKPFIRQLVTDCGDQPKSSVTANPYGRRSYSLRNQGAFWRLPGAELFEASEESGNDTALGSSLRSRTELEKGQRPSAILNHVLDDGFERAVSAARADRCACSMAVPLAFDDSPSGISSSILFWISSTNRVTLFTSHWVTLYGSKNPFVENSHQQRSTMGI